ncbi:hypothetical protein [Neptunomonas sp.]|uniref:hypothetical protein n=1 Tax=Neptunomonas sp. TaxID=1971898 RepID=UPI0025D570BE|nr:hypothetical protein [Neptunomonas sp.]
MPVDINGNTVKVGSKVRVLHIDPKITEYLPEEEVTDLDSMLNEVLEVYEIDEYDCAWVEKWWDRGDGQTESHSLSLSSAEMELV